MQAQRAPDGQTLSSELRMSDGYPLSISTGTFPVLGTRIPGVSQNFNDTSSLLGSMTPEELHRHQQSANGMRNDEPYHEMRVGSFPVPGARPGPGSMGGIPLAGSYLESQQTMQLPRTPLPIKSEAFESFLHDMPSAREDAPRHLMFTELIKLKTRTLELQIAEARQREREAELELARFKAEVQRHGQMVPNAQNDRNSQSGMEININPFTNNNDNPNHPSTNQQRGSMTAFPMANTSGPSMNSTASMGSLPNINQPLAPENAPTPMTSFDLEAMMHDANIDNLFSWLPEYNHDGQNTTMDPSGLFLPNMANTMSNPPSQNALPTFTSPTIKKRSPSPSSETSSPPPTKKSKRTIEKKAVVERHSNCLKCFNPIAKILIRAPKSQIPEHILVLFTCTSCSRTEQPSQLPEHSTLGSTIGTVDMRKRMRVSMEIDDEEKGLLDRRAFCDVCQRIIASGRVVGGRDGEGMSHMAEIICSACDAKYQRCTDCGGGGGPRVGIGKWRMKQVFQPGRKTCGLSHSRLGDRPREIGVHVTPTDFNEQQLKEVLTRTKGLWHEKTLTRLAVPEMLEIDLPPETINPLQDFADVEDIITRNWPTREAMICAKEVDGNRFKRLLGLIWAHAKPRRTVRSVDIEEEYAKNTEQDDEADMSTVLANIKRTNMVIPPGSELVGMWGGEWDMEQGSLLISTLIPFEGADGEDSTALSVGEMITKVQALRQAINSEREGYAKMTGTRSNLLPQCEHLWVVSGGTMPLVRERVADVLIRKRSFVHVEEYLTRHPEFKNALEARPYGLHPDLHRPLKGQLEGEEEEKQSDPLILVRWLGKDFDAQKILEIKQQEFGGGKTKLKKKAKGK